MILLSSWVTAVLAGFETCKQKARQGAGPSGLDQLPTRYDRQGSLGFIGGKAKKSRGDRVVTM